MLPKSFIIFTVIYLLFIFATAVVAYGLEKKKYARKGKDISFTAFLNNYQKVTPRIFFIGLIFGMVFGMMDNISLYFGIKGLSEYLKENYGMSDVKIAGFGNTYSGVLGITLASFVVLISQNIFPDVDQSELPAWLNTLGFLIGAIIGIYVPSFFVNTYKNYMQFT